MKITPAIPKTISSSAIIKRRLEMRGSMCTAWRKAVRRAFPEARKIGTARQLAAAICHLSEVRRRRHYGPATEVTRQRYRGVNYRFAADHFFMDLGPRIPHFRRFMTREHVLAGAKWMLKKSAKDHAASQKAQANAALIANRYPPLFPS